MALAAFDEVFPDYGKASSPERAERYCVALEDLSIADLRLGLTQAEKLCDRFPLPADIRKHATSGAVRLELEAEAELAKLDALVSEWGVDRMPVWVSKSAEHPDGFKRCPEIGGAMGHALASVGGWRAYAARSERDSPFMRKDIIASYVRLRRAEQGGWTLIEAGRGAMAGEIAAAAAGRSI